MYMLNVVRLWKSVTEVTVSLVSPLKMVFYFHCAYDERLENVHLGRGRLVCHWAGKSHLLPLSQQKVSLFAIIISLTHGADFVLILADILQLVFEERPCWAFENDAHGLSLLLLGDVAQGTKRLVYFENVLNVLVVAPREWRLSEEGLDQVSYVRRKSTVFIIVTVRDVRRLATCIFFLLYYEWCFVTFFTYAPSRPSLCRYRIDLKSLDNSWFWPAFSLGNL